MLYNELLESKKGANMLKKTIISVIFMVTVNAVILFRTSSAYTIDGSLADWGVRPGLYGSSQWIPSQAGIHYNFDDQNPLYSYVGPGYGGQSYDVEAIYATWDAQNLYYAVVTGLPQSGLNYKPGAIAFDFGIDDVYPYGDSYEYGIETVGNGRTAGALYSVATWGQGLSSWDGYHILGYVSAPANILAINGSTPLATGNMSYTLGFEYINGTKTYYPGSHYVIEGSIPLTGFGDDWGEAFRIHHTQTCGNNALNLDIPAIPAIPEPASLSLLGLGMLGLLGLGRKKTHKKEEAEKE